MNFNPLDYLTNDEKKELAKRAMADQLSRCTDTQSLGTILSNTAYAIVMQKVRDELGEDMVESIKDGVKKILSDPKKVEYCLFYDGSLFNETHKGAALAIAEQYVQSSCIRRIHNLVDKVLDTIKLNTKKFEKMVMQEAARLVAEKMAAAK